jgi:hypothetical protein
VNRALRPFSALLVLALVAAACTSNGSSGVGDGVGGPSGSASAPSSPDAVLAPEEGPGSALAALDELCTIPVPDAPPAVPEEGPTPPAIAEVMAQLEEIRGFTFTERVVAEPVSQQDIADGYAAYVEAAYPEEFYARRSAAWQTIGVIPKGASIREALLSYGSTQVIGYYDTVTGELRFIGEEDPSPLERITLAHELTHAIDDQRFALERIDRLGAECRDEELEAAIALVEGNATFFMLRWAQTFLTPAEQLQVGAEAAGQAPPPGDIPPFIDAIQEWPYLEGLSFISRLERDGGLAAVDAAFESPPVSTEQVIHPERYPNDLPVPVDVTDLAPALGEDWTDLDVQGVGEMWLTLALELRLGDAESEGAAAGWDGGIYRAWTNGDRVALVLATAWDSEADAQEFAAVMQDWIEASGRPATVLGPEEASTVRVLFASDRGTLDLLASVAN